MSVNVVFIRKVKRLDRKIYKIDGRKGKPKEENNQRSRP